MQTTFNEVQKFLLSGTTAEIAQKLLGKRLCFQTKTGVMTAFIVEAEAYIGPKDQAAHAFQGHRTPKNEPLYHEAGTIYIYQMRTQLLLNLITQKENDPQGVLIRAIQPEKGLTQFQKNREVHQLFELTNGPGKLMQAFGIPKILKGSRLNEGPLSLDLQNFKIPAVIKESGRIGVPNKGIWTNEPLRYFVAGNPYVSRMRKRDIDSKNYGWQ
ncbi:DNA-3-methyladenine glycosylase [Pediococcus ethanolidurans]|uniref:DNA-3-methyladenine glycosylase n=1 Tax=Pediococcus ethanolidurans TaxID=319653 RepID=UPI001C1E9420|nr:DNA-3-methyladenine glycosylase [Pediococcus ethanolidurans]MBU7554962.1 DNA-3-methyladenine glycosylase [Pediococcus ethanolidurans]MBU7563269.1 DNA-3-methyladenine glycosylase [Pediococcus ethanolidurans]MCT4397696.1 DNA-3-methyladenine glycosylase [Pediococcus ethanolidurans]MCV3314701.1 DNA-3-methyladenine glycosylase [Pediococcus ethanolidurans]MCV3321696.1 DNA-3-methyladenine glycosylase [Pediococcus ethanolidurans]